MGVAKVLGFAGSLRSGSINRALLRASTELAPEGMRIEIFDLEGIPLYNMDLEPDFPSRVVEFNEAIRSADGLLVATPEHNHSFSGVLKNALDWASRPVQTTPLNGKPVIVQSASPGWTGGLRAQMHLRQVFAYFPMRHMYYPEVCVGGARTKFDADLKMIDEFSIGRIREQLSEFLKFIREAPAQREA
jgi:chromate reductase